MFRDDFIRFVIFLRGIPVYGGPQTSQSYNSTNPGLPILLLCSYGLHRLENIIPHIEVFRLTRLGSNVFTQALATNLALEGPIPLGLTFKNELNF